MVLNIMLKFFVAFFFMFGFSSTAEAMAIPGDICLHPVEMAALLHGKPTKKSVADQITDKENEIENVKNSRKNIQKKISAYKNKLDNSFDEKKLSLTDTPWSKLAEGKRKEGMKADMAEAVAQYIEGQESDWTDLELEGAYTEGVDTKHFPWNDKPGKYFLEDGEVDASALCNKYALKNRIEECEDSIDGLARQYQRLLRKEARLDKLEESLERLEERQEDIADGLAKDDTESGALCFSCLDEVRELDQPTAGQIFGDLLSVAAGGALSYYGYREGRREGRDLNDLRMMQGFAPTSSSPLAWAGASLGLPFISNGVHGLSGGRSVFGSYACNQGYASGAANMYGPFAQYGLNSQASMMGPFAQQGPWWAPNMNPMMMAGMNPMMGGMNPMMMAGMNPMMGGMNPAMMLNINPMMGGMNPMMMAGMNPMMGGMNPAMMLNINPMMGGMNPMMMAGMNPMMGGMNPMMMAGMNPMMGPTAMPNFQAQIFQQAQMQQYSQYMQYQQAQMQAQMQAQQAWIQHQQSIQQDRMRRAEAISALMQEMSSIQQQIQMVAYGGMNTSYSGSSQITPLPSLPYGGPQGPDHQPVAPPTSPSSGGITVEEGW